MWVDALAVKERTKDGGSQETDWGRMEDKKMELTTLMKHLRFSICFDVMLESQSHFQVEAKYIFA